MQGANDTIVVDGNMSSDIESDPIRCVQECLLSIQVVWTGAPTGTFKLQVSDDVGSAPVGSPVAGLINWTDYDGSSYAVTADSGNGIWAITSAPDRWYRLIWTSSSGSGTLNARFENKGV